MSAAQAVVWVAGAVVTLASFTAVLWWLVWPRIEDKLQEVAGEVRTMQGQLTDDAPDTIGRHARMAADAAAELPALREELAALATTVGGFEAWRSETDRRLGDLYAIVVALVGPDLRRRLFEEWTTEDEERRKQR